jgi:plastocyanin
MAKISGRIMSDNIITNLRIVPRAGDFLDRKLGVRGEIFFDQTSNTLRLYNGITTGGIQLAKSDLTNIANATFLAKANAAGVAGAAINSFSTIAVEGQVSVVADSNADTLTLAAGSGIAITTNVSTDTILITNSYSLPTATTSILGGVRVDGTTITITDGVISSTVNTDNSANEQFNFNIAADDSTLISVNSGNVIKFVGAGSVTTTTTPDGYVTITGATASTTFPSLTDVSTSGLTIDKVYMPAITMLAVTRTGVTAYNFDQYSGGNPTLYAISGTTIAFNLSVAGHPFLIQDGAATNISTGLTHVSTAGVVSTGSNAQGKTTGTLYWKIPQSVSGTYRYQCSIHAAMVGSITVRDFAVI